MKKRHLKKYIKKVEAYGDFYARFTKLAPEFAGQIADPHNNDTYNSNIRRLNKYKVDQIRKLYKKYKAKEPLGAMSLFIMKLDLAKYENWDMHGKLTKEQALRSLGL